MTPSKRVKVSPLAKVAMSRVGPANIEPLVVALVDAVRQDDETKAVAARSLNNLACDAAFRVDIARAGGIQPLVDLVRNGRYEEKQLAVCALKMLAFANHANKVLIRIAGGIEPLIANVHDGTFAAAALSNLAVDAENRVAIAQAGGIERLLTQVREGRGAWRGDAAAALLNLALDDANRSAIAKAGGIEILVELARDGGEEERRHAMNALRVLMVNNDENLVAVSKAAAAAGIHLG